MVLVEKCSEEYEHSLNHHPHVILSHEDEEEDMVHHDHADHDHVGHFSSLLEVGTRSSSELTRTLNLSLITQISLSKH